MPSTKTQRWLDLLALLVGRSFPISVDDIMEGVPAYRAGLERGGDTAKATVQRMFERDKDELRRLGIPLTTRRYRMDGVEVEGYLVTRRDFYFPYLELLPGGTRPAGAEEADRDTPSSFRHDAPGAAPAFPSPRAVGRVTLAEEDAASALLALRSVLSLPSFPFLDDARSALGKLTFDLDPALDDPALGKSLVRLLDRPGGADPHGVLGTLLDALYDRRRVAFRYRSVGRDVEGEREAEPWGLLLSWGAWYLAGRDPEKEGVRLFRVDRMEGVRASRPGGAAPDFQVPPDFDVRRLSGRKPWELGEEGDPAEEVVVRFLPPASLLAVRNGWGDPVDKGGDPAEGGAPAVTAPVHRRFSVRRRHPFLRWILSLAGEARVLSPPDAAEELEEMARTVIRAHRRDG